VNSGRPLEGENWEKKEEKKGLWNTYEKQGGNQKEKAKTLLVGGLGGWGLRKEFLVYSFKD